MIVFPLQDDQTGEYLFYMKGADVVMSSIVHYNDWLEEEVDNMAREGLRTLVVAKKSLTAEQYHDFEVCFKYDGKYYIIIVNNYYYIFISNVT